MDSNWRVLKLVEDPSCEGPLWDEIGEIAGREGYASLPPAPETLGETYGPGKYVLLRDGRYEEPEIEAVTNYRAVGE
jgi:hypothetical protein